MGTLSGEREDIPEDCPAEFASLIVDCWKQEPEERPGIAEI